MTEEEKDVKPEGASPTPVQEEKKTPEAVSEDVKTPKVDGQVDQKVYEKVRESMRAEREAKKAEKARNSELEARIAELESQTHREERPTNSYEAKTDLLLRINKDAFLRDNLDLVEDKMTETGMDVSSATNAVKAEIFDRVQKELPSEGIKPLIQQRPTAAAEPRTEVEAPTFKDILAGKVEIDPKQLEAIRRAMPRQK